MNTHKEQWESGKQHEIDFWTEWFETGGLQWKEEYKNRLDENLPFPEFLIEYLPDRPEITVLDVGAGPLTLLGKVLPGRKLTITAVDALADIYDKIMERCHIVPLVRTQYCEAERLSEKFPAGSFDLVYMQNALDHSYDPMEGIKQMLHVVKNDCCVFLSHATNEAERENYSGFHQWNFCMEGDKFIIWNKDARIDVASELSGYAEVTVRGDDAWNQVMMKKIDFQAP